MRGFLMFDPHNSLIFAHGNKEFQEHISEKQDEMTVDSPSSGFSELTLDEPVSETSSITTEDQPSCSSLHDSTIWDYGNLTHVFLPLVILYRTRIAFCQDAYRSVYMKDLRISFHPLRDHLLVIFIGTLDKRYAEIVLQILEFCFGPGVQNFSASDTTFLSLLDYVEESSDGTPKNGEIDEQMFQWISNSINISAFLRDPNSSVSRSLETMGREFQVFMATSICILVKDHSFLAARENVLEEEADEFMDSFSLQNSTVASARDILMLLQICPDSRTPTEGPVLPVHHQIWLENPHRPKEILPIDQQQRSESYSGRYHRFPWDMFRYEIMPGTHLVCLSRITHSEILAHIGPVLEMLDQLDRDVSKIDEIVNRIDKSIGRVAQLLNDLVMSPQMLYEDERSEYSSCVFSSTEMLHNLQSTSRRIQKSWHTFFQTVAESIRSNEDSLKQNETFFSSSVFKKFSWKLDNQIESLITQLLSLSSELIKSSKGSVGYKLTLFEKCWTRLHTSPLYRTSTRMLLNNMPTTGFPSLPPSLFKIDAIGYLFIRPKKGICLLFLPEDPQLKKKLFLEISVLLQSQQARHCLVIVPTEPSEDSFMLSLANQGAKGEGKSQRTFLRLFKREKQAPVRFSTIPEPIWCLGLFEPGVNRDLALGQVEKLATRLYLESQQLQWNFS